LKQPLTLNKYVYANGDPLSGEDPSGLMTLQETAAATRISFGLDSAEENFGNDFLGAALDPDSFAGALALDCAAAIAPAVVKRAAALIGKAFIRGKPLFIYAGRAGLAKTLEALTFFGTATQQAHHVVSFSGKNYFAVQSRAILAKYHININSPLNGVWLEKAVHNGRHLKEYDRLIYEELNAADQLGADAVRARLGTLRMRLANGEFDAFL